MAQANTLCKQLLGVKSAVVTGHDFYQDSDGVNHLRIRAHPDSVLCPEHGVLVADVPCAYPGSGFTKDFDLTVGWLTVYLPRSAVSEDMRIDWETAGRCVHRTLNEIEPERSRRLDHLVNIGIDETSYRKGHKYITIVVNHDTNTVVWAAQGHGKKVLEQFYRQLTPGQPKRIPEGKGGRKRTTLAQRSLPPPKQEPKRSGTLLSLWGNPRSISRRTSRPVSP